MKAQLNFRLGKKKLSNKTIPF